MKKLLRRVLHLHFYEIIVNFLNQDEYFVKKKGFFSTHYWLHKPYMCLGGMDRHVAKIMLTVSDNYLIKIDDPFEPNRDYFARC